MLSRIFWAGMAGIALVAGITMQDGSRIFSWAADHTDISSTTEQAIAASVDRAVEGSFDQMKIVGSDGQQIDVPAETKRRLADAVGRLLKAKTDLALLRVGDASDEEIRAAEISSAEARSEVDRLKAEIKQLEQGPAVDGDAMREQIQQEVREEVRAAVREAVRN